jgi:hypothetical protein
MHMQALQLGDWSVFVGSNSQAIIEVPIELYSGVGKGDTEAVKHMYCGLLR